MRRCGTIINSTRIPSPTALGNGNAYTQCIMWRRSLTIRPLRFIAWWKVLLIAAQIRYSTLHMDFIAPENTMTPEAKCFASSTISLLLEGADESMKLDLCVLFGMHKWTQKQIVVLLAHEIMHKGRYVLCREVMQLDNFLPNTNLLQSLWVVIQGKRWRPKASGL